MTRKLLSIVQFWMVIIGGCLLLTCAPTASLGQGGSGKLVNKPATPAKTAPSKTSKSMKKSSTARTRRTNNAREAAAATERTYWESIRASSNPEDFQAYLNKYPNGEFVDLAKNRLRMLETARTKSTNVKDSPESKNNSQSLENTSPSWQIVGVWRANDNEFGYDWEMTFTASADGTYKYFARSAQGHTATDYGFWQYSGGILYQKFSNGASGKGSIKWIDSNTFELTIIDNGTPAYSGVKRRYRRIK